MRSNICHTRTINLQIYLRPSGHQFLVKDNRMKAKVVSIDYWETLFVHVGNPSFRKNVRKECYDKHLVALGLNELANVSNSFFDVIDKEVKLTWQTGISPKRDDLIKHAARYYGQSVSIATLEKLLDATYELYTKQ